MPPLIAAPTVARARSNANLARRHAAEAFALFQAADRIAVELQREADEQERGLGVLATPPGWDIDGAEDEGPVVLVSSDEYTKARGYRLIYSEPAGNDGRLPPVRYWANASAFHEWADSLTDEGREEILRRGFGQAVLATPDLASGERQDTIDDRARRVAATEAEIDPALNRRLSELANAEAADAGWTFPAGPLCLSNGLGYVKYFDPRNGFAIVTTTDPREALQMCPNRAAWEIALRQLGGEKTRAALVRGGFHPEQRPTDAEMRRKALAELSREEHYDTRDDPMPEPSDAEIDRAASIAAAETVRGEMRATRHACDGTCRKPAG